MSNLCTATYEDDSNDCQTTCPEKCLVESSLSNCSHEEDRNLIIKWGTKSIEVPFSSIDWETFTILDLRQRIEDELSIPKDKQKFLGITINNKPPNNDAALMDLTFKKPLTFTLLGTPLDQHLKDVPEDGTVVNDLNNWDFLPTDADNIRTDLHIKRLNKAIAKTEIQFINPLRPGRKLLVLDLDYTLFDCKPNTLGSMADLKRPHLEYFLASVYPFYDLVIWSQTSWKWVELKCTELGLLTSNQYKLSFVLDQSSMFTVTSKTKEGEVKSHQVKALEIIWAKLPTNQYGPKNTVHVDDLSRNFAMNPKQGVKVSTYRIVKKHTDQDLKILTTYLIKLAQLPDLSNVDHTKWKTKADKM
eukprot:Platyproteum_vivax@DN1350_c0_g1_i1.p1